MLPTNMSGALSRFEARAVLIAVVGGCLLGSSWLVIRSHARARVLESRSGRLIFTSASYADSTGPVPRVLIDGDPRTAIRDLNAPARWSGPRPIPDSPSARGPQPRWLWKLDRPFIQIQVGLTHSPDRPPRVNPLKALRIWTGNQKDAQSFRASARPKSVRLHFFRQQVVDPDREYRLPEEPVYWMSRDVRLRDIFGMQRIDLDWLPAAVESPAFPREVQQIWLRMEILDSYPGTDPAQRDAIAVSEIEFLFRDRHAH